MANIFSLFTVPTVNGSGPAVDVSGMGGSKTIKIEGAFNGMISVEASLDGGVTWGAILQMNDEGTKEVTGAFQFMRVTRSLVPNGLGAPAPFVSVASDDAGSLFAAIPVPSTPGVGAGVDVSGLGVVNSISVVDDVGGANGIVEFEMSDDNVNFSPIPRMQFSADGLKTSLFTAQFVRARRSGGPVSSSPPAVTTANIGAANLSGGGGSAAGGALVFEPGSANTGPVFFNNWADLMNELTSLRAAAGGDAPFTIYFDSTGGLCQIPAGSHDMTNVTWKVLPVVDIGQASIRVLDGGQVPNLSRIEGPISLSWDGASAVVPLLGVDGQRIIMYNVFARAAATGGNPFMQPNSSADDFMVELRENTQWRAQGTSPVLNVDPGPGGGRVELWVDADSIIDTDSIRGAGGDELQIVAGGHVQALPNYAGGTTGFEARPPRWELIGPTAATPITAEFGQLIRSNSAAGARVVNLPAISELNAGDSIVVKESSGAPTTITVTPAGADTIDGAATFVINNPNVSITLVSDGQGDWIVI